MSLKPGVRVGWRNNIPRLILHSFKRIFRLHGLKVILTIFLFACSINMISDFRESDRHFPVRAEVMQSFIAATPPRDAKKSVTIAQNNSGSLEVEEPFNKTISASKTKWIHFIDKLHKKPNGAGNKRLLTYVKNVAKKKWEQNTANRDAFRKSLRAELGEEGAVENFLLTKKNTKPEAKINYYMTGTYKNTSREFWRNLPEDTPYTPGRFKTCSIIGSSGITKNSGCGSKINKADYVIRFNLANVKGYEADVGSVTNFTTLNPSFIVFKLKYLKAKEHVDKFEAVMSEFNGSHLWLPAFGVDWSFDAIMDAAKRARKYTQVIIGNPGHIKQPTELWSRTMNLKMAKRWLSSGFYMILTFMDVCDQINVFGFWPFKTSVDGKPVPFHYFKDNGKAIGHSFDLEFKSLISLHEYGIIKMHFGKCT